MDEKAWLIEMQDGGKPTWWCRLDDEDGVERHHVDVTLELLREGVGKPREATVMHPQC